MSGTIPSESARSTDAEPSVGFVCCVESVSLEDQTVLMASSIRRFAGTLADAPIFAVSPRAGHEPSSATIDALRALDVTVVVEPLNVDHPDREDHSAPEEKTSMRSPSGSKTKNA